MRTVFWWGKPKDRGHLENLGVDGRILLKCISKIQDVRVWTGYIWLMRDTCEEGNGLHVS